MAIVTGKHVTGVLGPVTLKRYRKKQTMSIKAGKIKQTAATKKCSDTFGKANMLVQSIRERFSSQIRGFHDGKMYNRMNSAMSKIFYECRNTEGSDFTFVQDSFENLADFDFNINSRLIDSLRKKPKVNLEGNVFTIAIDELKIPAQLKFPARSKFCKITMRLLLYRLKESLMIGLPEEQSLLITKDQTVLEAKEFRFKVPDGCLCVAGFFLDFYYTSGEFQVLLNNPAFSPGSIVGALITPGGYREIDKRAWRAVIGLEWK